jgi:hypothetical protein
VSLLHRGDGPPGGALRGDRAEQRQLIAQGTQVAERVPAVGEHHRQVAQHRARIMGRATLAGVGHRLAQRLCEAEPVGELNKERAAGVRHKAGGVRDDL